MHYFITFEEFVAYFREHLTEGWCEDRTLTIQKVTKNNGQIYTGLSLRREGEVVVPTLYLDDAYQKYEEGIDLEHVINWFRLCYELALEKMLDIPLDIGGFEDLRSNIIFKLVHYEKNRAMLENSPHLKLCDLAVTFRCMVSHDDDSMSSMLVSNDMMEEWDVSLEELLLIARENTMRIFPGQIRSMSEFLQIDRRPGDEGETMFIATNEQMMNGASVILYDGLLEEFADAIGGNYYILPSSIHEMIFVPEELVEDRRDLSELIHECNENVVAAEDVLSDSLYYYDSKTGKMTCCSCA